MAKCVVNYFNIELELKLKGDSDMWLVLEITRIVLPLLIVGGIGIFVVKRLEYKHKHDKLERRNQKPLKIY
jgi:hypothetical protein